MILRYSSQPVWRLAITRHHEVVLTRNQGIMIPLNLLQPARASESMENLRLYCEDLSNPGVKTENNLKKTSGTICVYEYVLGASYVLLGLSMLFL